MPVYNGERFLRVAIESVLCQTFSDFDFHIVDDGSRDGTPDILAEYARRDRRIVIHTQPQNVGLAAALNIGCRAASADIVARMDADDVSLPERFARQLEYLGDQSDIGVLGTYVRSLDEHDRIGEVWPCPAQPGLAAWSMLFYCAMAHPTIMIRRSVLEAVGFYPSGYPAEDYALFMRLIRITRIMSLPEVLLHYRVLSTSYTRAGWERLERDSARTVRESVGALQIGPLSDRDIELMRDLARHHYPSQVTEIDRLRELITSLRSRQVTLPPLSGDDVRAINRDAGVRLWLLAALAVRRGSLSLAARCAGQAAQASPSSFLQFAAKAAKNAFK
jgi:glycosyltransferase involved in cell wall biosynthesis